MLLGIILLPNITFAQSNWNSGGDGKTKETAYQTSNAEQFYNFVTGVNNNSIKTTYTKNVKGNDQGWSFDATLVSYFELADDIDLSTLTPDKMAVKISKKEVSYIWYYEYKKGDWIGGTQKAEDKIVKYNESVVEANYLSAPFTIVTSFPYSWTSSETSKQISFSSLTDSKNDEKETDKNLGYSENAQYGGNKERHKFTKTEYTYTLITYKEIKPIKNFAGRFDGKGYVIKNLIINQPNDEKVGLFANIDAQQNSSMCDAVGVSSNNLTYQQFTTAVEGIGLENSMIIGKNKVGGIVGYTFYIEYVKDCWLKNTDVVGVSSIGGICGDNGTGQFSMCNDQTSYTTIQGCYVLSDIAQEDGKNKYKHFITAHNTPNNTWSDANYCAGICAADQMNVNIKDCYSAIGIRCENSANGQFGPIIAGQLSETAEIGGTYFIKDWNVDENTSGSSYEEGNNNANQDKWKQNVKKENDINALNNALKEDTDNTLVVDEWNLNDGAPMTAAQYNRLCGVEVDMVAGKWNLFGPTYSGSVDMLNQNKQKADMAALKYDYSSNGWNNTYLAITNGDNLELGQGYFVWAFNKTKDGTSISLTDSKVTVMQRQCTKKEVNVNLTNSGNVAGSGDNKGKWFALSNPFNATDVEISGTDANNIQGNGWIYTFDATNNKWNSGANDFTAIKQGQGFMVATTNNQNSLNITLKPKTAAKKSGKVNNLIVFTSESNGFTSNLYADINDKASNGFDSRDAYMMISTNNNLLAEPYFVVESTALVKNEFKTLPYTADLNFHAGQSSDVKFSLTNVPEDIIVTIIDIENDGKETVLNDAVFNFTANAGENANRFKVKFTAKNPASQDLNIEDITINNLNNVLNIDGKDLNLIRIFDYAGNEIMATEFEGDSFRKDISSLTKGIYIVNAVSKTSAVSKKIIVQ